MEDKLAMELATNIMHELKSSARRWFIAFCIMVIMEIVTIVGFIWYISLPLDETTMEQNVEDIADDNDIRQIIGDDK